MSLIDQPTGSQLDVLNAFGLVLDRFIVASYMCVLGT